METITPTNVHMPKSNVHMPILFEFETQSKRRCRIMFVKYEHQIDHLRKQWPNQHYLNWMRIPMIGMFIFNKIDCGLNLKYCHGNGDNYL